MSIRFRRRLLTDATQQIVEPRVAMKRLEARIGPQDPADLKRALLVRSVEPAERFIHFTEAGVHPGNIVRRDVLCSGALIEFVKNPLRLVNPPGPRMGIT